MPPLPHPCGSATDLPAPVLKARKAWRTLPSRRGGRRATSTSIPTFPGAGLRYTLPPCTVRSHSQVSLWAGWATKLPTVLLLPHTCTPRPRGTLPPTWAPLSYEGGEGNRNPLSCAFWAKEKLRTTTEAWSRSAASVPTARLHWVLSTAASTVPPPVPGLGATAAPGWLPVRRGCLKASGPWNLWSLESLTYDPQRCGCVHVCVRTRPCTH